MYRKQVRRRRAVLVLLVVACLVLISTAITEAESGPLKSVQNGLSSVFGPIQEGADRALKPIRDMIGWFDETFEARGENEDLRDQVAELRAELLETQDAVEKAGYQKQVQKLLAEDTLAGFEPVEARVIGKSATVWYDSVTIDQGSNAGIRVDDAVITSQGLVGRVSSTSSNVARVALITDGTTAVTARVAQRGVEGLVESEVGSGGDLVFGLIEPGKEVEDGDRLVTAGFTDEEGLDSRYPAEIPIGEVTETRPGEQEQRQSITVKAFADIPNLSSVTVLTGGGS